MNDPERLIEVGASRLERMMLEAGSAESPSLELQLSMARGLGLSGSGLPVAPVPQTATATATAPTAIPAAAATATSTVAASTVWISAGIVAVVVAAVVGVRTVWSTRAGEQPAAIATAARPVASNQAGSNQIAGDQIADEIRLLDGARASLQAGVSDRALEQLATYVRRHPRGTLQPEAMVLQIEALQQDGKRDDAVALSRRFLTTYPDSPLVERVERVSGLRRR